MIVYCLCRAYTAPCSIPQCQCSVLCIQCAYSVNMTKLQQGRYSLPCVPVFIFLFPPQILWSDSRGKTGNLLIEGFFWIPAFLKSIKPYNKSISIYPHQPGWDPIKTFVYISHSNDGGKIQQTFLCIIKTIVNIQVISHYSIKRHKLFISALINQAGIQSKPLFTYPFHIQMMVGKFNRHFCA